MTNTEVKQSFHELIDDFKNEKLLKQMYDFMAILKEKQANSEEDWWNLLTDHQKEELDLAIKESEDESNWVTHEQVMKDTAEWLKK